MATSQMGKSALGRGAAMVGGVGGARAFPGMATDMRTGRAAGRALGAGVGPNGKTTTSRTEVEAQKRAREAAARAALSASAAAGFARFDGSERPLFDDARGQRGLNGGFPANAPVPARLRRRRRTRPPRRRFAWRRWTTRNFSGRTWTRFERRRRWPRRSARTIPTRGGNRSKI